MIPKEVKALVLDFGNVVIDIDVSLTYQAFAAASMKPIERIEQIFTENQIFKRYETGVFDTYEFREVVRQSIGYPLSDAEIDKAWNALLLEVPYERVKRILDMQAKYPIYLLSNTNSLHIETCNTYFDKSFSIPKVEDLFTKAFYSYEMGLWKPDKKIYQAVLDAININAEEVLFIDDNLDNIESASEMGIHCVHLKSGDNILNHLVI